MQNGGEKALLALEERKAKRKQVELQEALDSIQRRVSLALHEYEYMKKPVIPSSKQVSSSTDESVTITIEDPSQLYEILADVKERQKYKNMSKVVMVEYEDRIDARTEILQEIEEFFIERQSGGSHKLLEEITIDEIDLEAATAGIENALDVAKQASQRLITLQTEMIRLLSMNSQFPDTKKGRSKMEKAILKAQEEVQDLTDTLVSKSADLKLAEERTLDLKKKLDSKSSEVSRLAKEAQQIKQLTSTNAALQRDLDNAKSVIQRTRGELETARHKKAVKSPAQPHVFEESNVDQLEATIAALTADLGKSTETRDALQKQLDEAGKQHEGTISQLKDHFKVEIEEMREKFEDQIKSLADIDDPFDNEEEVEPIENTEYDQEFRDLQEDDDAQVEPAPVKDEAAVRDSVPEKKSSLTDETASVLVTPVDKEEENESVSTNYAPASCSPSVLSPFRPDSTQSAPSPIMSVKSLTLRQMEMSSKEQFEKFKKELADSERKWKDEVADIRNKGKKALLGTKAQLIEVQNKHNQETEAIRQELEQKVVTIEELRSKTTTLKDQLLGTKTECGMMAIKYRESIGHLNEVNTAMTVLQQLVGGLENQPGAVAAEMRDLISRSIQYSTPPITRPPTALPPFATDDCTQTSTQFTPDLMEAESVISIENSPSAMPSIPDAVSPSQNQVHSVSTSATPNQNVIRSFPNSPTSNRKGVKSIPGSATPNRNQASRNSFARRSSSSLVPVVPMTPVRCASTPPIAHGPVSLRDSSFLRSIVFDSSLGATDHEMPEPSSTQPTNRQMGQVSVPPAVIQRLSSDHPIVKEWTKAYKSVVTFKEHITCIIADHSIRRDLVSALVDISMPQFSPDAEVQGQITQMRCHLALMLHKMEQVLQEALSYVPVMQADYERLAGDNTTALVMNENTHLKVTIRGLEEQLTTKESSYKLQMNRSHEAISQLESTVMGLQKEVTMLRRAAKENGSSRNEMIMFTRLDSERNEKNLNRALHQGTVTPDDVADVKQNMAEYVGLQVQRFAQLSKGLQRKHFDQKLLFALESEVQSDALQAMKEKASELQEKKKARWSLEMHRISLKREKLAHVLTLKLNQIEAAAGTFLIKPIISDSSATAPVITPIRKPLPAQRLTVLPCRQKTPAFSSAQPDVKVVRIVSKPYSRDAGDAKHPKLRLIEKILTHNNRVKDERTFGKEELSFVRSPPLVTVKSKTKGFGEREWTVADSRGQPSPDPLHPALPKIQELDICHPHFLPAHRPRLIRTLTSPTAHALPSIRLAMPECTH